jgi:hypothetical protein
MQDNKLVHELRAKWLQYRSIDTAGDDDLAFEPRDAAPNQLTFGQFYELFMGRYFSSETVSCKKLPMTAPR